MIIEKRRVVIGKGRRIKKLVGRYKLLRYSAANDRRTPRRQLYYVIVFLTKKRGDESDSLAQLKIQCCLSASQIKVRVDGRGYVVV